jgi:hypothetical protein
MVDSFENLSMKVELTISCRNLKDLDTFSKSDPQCKVYEKIGTKWVKRGRTERIQNNLNPDFKTPFVMNYFFEKAQELKFVVIDGDGDNDDNDKKDTIGKLKATMGSIMGSRAQVFT